MGWHIITFMDVQLTVFRFVLCAGNGLVNIKIPHRHLGNFFCKSEDFSLAKNKSFVVVASFNAKIT